MRTHRVGTLLILLALVALALAPAGASVAPSKHAASGQITAVDPQAQTVSVKIKDKTETFKLDSKASLSSAGKAIQLADLKVGEKVEVTYTGEQQNLVASRISVAKGAA